MAIQLFTPTSANRTLPLVKRIVADILSKGRELRALADEADTEEPRVAELERDLRGHLNELAAIGCEYKDWNFEHGLVDFPGELGGEPVLWCWRSDEDDVLWYHTPEAGFAGRTRIPSELLAETPTPSE